MELQQWWLVPALAVVWLLAWVLVGWVVVLMIRDTARRRGRWGVNPRPAACPRCGRRLSRRWVPRSFRQAMWGGYTCRSCGCEADKWGREPARNGPRGGDNAPAS